MQKREWRKPGDLQAVLEQVALSALDGAACELGTSREELVLALRDEKSLDAFAAEHTSPARRRSAQSTTGSSAPSPRRKRRAASQASSPR